VIEREVVDVREVVELRNAAGQVVVAEVQRTQVGVSGRYGARKVVIRRVEVSELLIGSKIRNNASQLIVTHVDP